MKDPREIKIQDYTYNLPSKRIADFPLAERDASKLLIYNNGEIKEDIFKKIASQLPKDTLLVFNDTKVVEARLLFQKQTGGVIEIFCLEPHDQYPDITTALATTGKVWWRCLVGGASKWKKDQVLEKKIHSPAGEITVQTKYIEKNTENFVIEFAWSPSHLSFAELLHDAGAIPLPPYIRRKPETSDSERYQTVYAHFEGSVAAPTAGLHFTKKIFEELKTKNINTEYLTLHVGAGTFKPVKSATIGEHEMHAEWFEVERKTIESIIDNLDNKIVAVGTTSLRTIESLYWLGIKNSLVLDQWEPYELEKMPVKKALSNLIAKLDQTKTDRLIARTQILIAPGYEFKIVKGLITNFHQPQSTLLLLVAAFIGHDWKKVYDYALDNEYRFLSYGDGNLLWRT